jgi:xanthine dehydrogenase accessory factor
MKHWIEDLRRSSGSGEHCVMVTIAAVRGSAPRETGAKMIVTRTETIGSIGGGQLEYRCARIAFDILNNTQPVARKVHRFPLGSGMGQCCGGVVDVLTESLATISPAVRHEMLRLYDNRVPFVIATSESQKFVVTADAVFPDGEFSRGVVAHARQMLADRSASALVSHIASEKVLLEPVLDSDFNVAVFGAGHVGAATAAILAGLDCNLRWIDSRRHFFPDWAAGKVTTVEAADPSAEVAAMPHGAYYLVMTHSHPLDYEICATVLARGDFAYCGLIGSQSKRRRFEKMMRQQGVSPSVLDRLTCPIGLQGITGKAPQEIAVAVVAEFLSLRSAASVTRVRRDYVQHI